MSESLVHAEKELRPIKHRYLLVIHIPVYLDHAGARWTDPLWAKDLHLHLGYLADFTLACPMYFGPPPPNSSRLDDVGIQYIGLPPRLKSPKGLLKAIALLWQGVGRSEVVHSGLGGWSPISLGNLTAVITVLKRKYFLVVVESSPWRLIPGQSAPLIARIKAGLSEWINRRCLARTNFALFTQDGYLRDLLPAPRAGQSAHVIHASWIDADVILSEQEAAEGWSFKLPADQAIPQSRLLFVGRLTAAKGVFVLLEALKRLDAIGRTFEFAILGAGELLDACHEAARSFKHVRLVILDPVTYGPDFFNLVRNHHALVVPSVTDEQPRIVYDAYSQAVPVLACSTDGLKACVEDGVTGWLCPPNDPSSLSNLIDKAATGELDLRGAGMSALQRSRGLTHQEMHRQRWALLQELLPQR